MPDPLVLLGTLAKVADNLSKSSAQVAFRLNSVRQQLNLDGNPLIENLVVFAEHLQAEAEEMVLSSTSSRSTTTSTVKAAAMNVSGDGGYKKPYEKGSSSVRPCRYWKTDGGCLKVDQCKWAHAKLEPHEGRCFRCSAPRGIVLPNGKALLEMMHRSMEGVELKEMIRRTTTRK